MPDINNLLELSKKIAIKAGERLENDELNNFQDYSHSNEIPKEVKAIADVVLEQDILTALSETEYPILSEEAGYIPGKSRMKSKYWFLVDPLDGTFNFIKGLGPCAVSIGFWDDRKPIFGVIYDINSSQLYWGGKNIGSYCNGTLINVSKIEKKEQAAICTGFPVRLKMDELDVMQDFWNLINSYAKVRMFGSAAISLLNVAKGAAEVYSEQSIMLWDVAAGIAIIEGAGGQVRFENSIQEYSLNVFASNNHLTEI